MLGLRFCARALPSCGERGPLFIAVRGPFTVVASLVAEHRLQTRRLSSCGSRAQSLRGTWDPPIPGLEPVSPPLAGRLPTTAPPGKPHGTVLLQAKDTGQQYQEKDMHLKCLKISCPGFFVYSLLGWIRHALSPGLKPPLLCVQSTY